MSEPTKTLRFSFGYWHTSGGERQPLHQYVPDLYGLGPRGGPFHDKPCPGCDWLRAKLLEGYHPLEV